MLHHIMKILFYNFFCGLDDDYKDLCFAFHVHESSIIFNELHEKLFNHEAHLKENNFSKTPISSSPTFKPPHNQHRPPSYYPKNSIIQSHPPLFIKPSFCYSYQPISHLLTSSLP